MWRPTLLKTNAMIKIQSPVYQLNLLPDVPLSRAVYCPLCHAGYFLFHVLPHMNNCRWMQSWCFRASCGSALSVQDIFDYHSLMVSKAFCGNAVKLSNSFPISYWAELPMARFPHIYACPISSCKVLRLGAFLDIIEAFKGSVVQGNPLSVA